MRRLSYSQVSLFTACPRKWYNQYMQKRWPPKPVAFAYGSDVHDIAESAMTYPDQVGKVASQKSFKYTDDPDTSRYLAVRMVKNARLLLLSEGIGDFRFTDETTYQTELKLNLSGFVGYVDLVAKNKSDCVLVDWKTTSVEYSEHDIVASDQLVAYSWLHLKVIGSMPIHVAYVTLNKKTASASLYYTTPTLSDTENWEAKVGAVRAQMERGDNWKNPSSCINQWGTCHFYRDCWKGQAWMVGEELPDF